MIASRPPHPVVLSVGRALPEHHVDQETLIAVFRELWSRKHHNAARLEDLHRAVGVGGRHLALPLSEYPPLDTFAKCNDAWLRVAVDLGERAVRDGLARAGLAPADVDQLFFVTVTGIATPSVDARLMNRLGLRPGVRRTPVFGLGCVAGAAVTARAADALRAWPGEVAVMLSVELCSLTLQRDDLSVANLVASGLFGDGAAAVVLAGGERAVGPGPRVLATRSIFYPDSERVMGWDVVEGGFKVVLAASVPQIVREHVGGDVDRFLADAGLTRRQIRHWVAHTGGPKVLEAFETSLELPEGALARSWRSLSEVGNLSSASVLFVLGELLDAGEARPGDLGLLLAMGPGFCAELVLLQW
ncbi:type III polyketide synthase [Anaeromyxobacter paludicola]|uniref:Alpha-pyrone synthesis polyketide synthase-like Pks11 n=1 Tax=Anaeromyxobacter paludicola TaxID=2918171 RepID=A0ABM7XE97_9BACT|nr:3-oxoacyl-[acyl-carrier-protein] synthase III C-terminal domain-containing protein [Anaeromyxobacter paludicola]BDG10133.1 alpha-pyrone synthesis polyketide synthase-like Pks11 [Anaeromyxobacter paludicola]